MDPNQLGTFYEAALTAGSILSGFIGTFLSFRIQREANYYRQPMVYFADENKREPRAIDVYVGLSRFPISLLLICLGAACSLFFGVFLPLAGLGHWSRFTVSPASILAGVVASIVLVIAYFFAELFHYQMLCIDGKEWSREGWIAAGGISVAVALAVITYVASRS